jgi:hypothetical protein
MVRFGYRRRLSLQASLQVEALRARTRHLLTNAAENWTATATLLVTIMNCPITATVIWHGSWPAAAEWPADRFGIKTAKSPRFTATANSDATAKDQEGVG